MLNDNKDITIVYHDEEDGAWQFFSSDKFVNYEEVAKIACLGEILEMDNSLLDLADLPVGYYAFRESKNDNWIIKRIAG